MTLHEAIIQVLAQDNSSLSPSQIADALNKNNWYVKKDGSSIKSNQIGARVTNYPHLFIKEGSLIGLKSKTGVQKINPIQKSKTSISAISSNSNLALKVLMNEKNFKPASTIDTLVSDEPGLYCIRIANINAFNTPFNKVLTERNHNIVYIGIASQSLKKRFLGQELRAKGHGTFFRSIGAVLGYTPPKGSLADKKNQNNYKFSAKDEHHIISWINNNLIVNWVPLNGDLNSIENELIKQHLPLLNIAGNPLALSELSELRNYCKRIARG
ncbi:GIY-YIG nuclease family protein [Lutibacter maritimus]|uniref:GIY-YIG catalytic domain-containing protein n=1 Tax=Lutibacter maritimus TaxID=593133 RepID=A0A1I6SQU4_9FLAO|nr:hypothetical protein [Lutibacter maritimus]SFS79273.1 hypothetical protein SAMN04488006_0059 [Lutibacter maritimus]